MSISLLTNSFSPVSIIFSIITSSILLVTISVIEQGLDKVCFVYLPFFGAITIIYLVEDAL